MAAVTYTAQWRDISNPDVTYTVSYAPGTHGSFAAQTTSGLTAGAATPMPPTVTGEKGWVFTGWSPLPTATVTGSATYTAQWVKEGSLVPPTGDVLAYGLVSLLLLSITGFAVTTRLRALR
jgi:hypothetical protein